MQHSDQSIDQDPDIEFAEYLKEHEQLLNLYFSYLESDSDVSQEAIDACVERINQLDEILLGILRQNV